MYSSLLEWCVFPFTLLTKTGQALNGDATYAPPKFYNCYRVDTTEIITDKYGKEYASKSQLYIPSTITVNDIDMIILDGTKKQEIHKLAVFYDGTTKEKSAQVIYL